MVRCLHAALAASFLVFALAAGFAAAQSPEPQPAAPPSAQPEAPEPPPPAPQQPPSVDAQAQPSPGETSPAAPPPISPPASTAQDSPAPAAPDANQPSAAPETPPASTAQQPPDPAPPPAAAQEAPPASTAQEPSTPPTSAAQEPSPAPPEAAPQEAPAQPAAAPEPAAPERARHHALSLIGTPKYAPDFKQFDYVNLQAPKGGAAKLWDIGTFDTLNVIPLRGEKAAGLGLIYDQLLVTSLDEASTEYGLLAEWISYPEDFSSVTFKLREQARWHDGQPVTPEDVIFSMDALKQGNPFYNQYYKNVTRGEKTGEMEVTFFFDAKNNRELPLITGQLTILPKHYWTANGPDGRPRDPFKTTLEPPLGSGPYRIKEAVAARHVVYERVPDYWAKDLPVRAGQFNLDTIRFDYYRDQNIAFEAFKGGQIDFFTESSAKNWATNYEFPALKRGAVVKRGDIVLKTPEPMQAFVFNTRRGKFADAKVRRAFNLAFNFEWANQNLFYGQYKRTGSFFQNTELAASGLPQGLELEILEGLRGQVPAEVFTSEFKNPVNSSPEEVRENRRQAVALLQEAGWSVKTEKKPEEPAGFFGRVLSAVGLGSERTEFVLRNAAGEAMEIEFLLVSPAFERVALPYMQSLEQLGVKSTLRVIDTPQYKERTDNFDFDAIVGSFAQSESPGNEQRDFWSSEAADKPGARNDAGMKNPAVDKLVDRIIFAKNREELVAACRALDRVLLWNHYVVPQWHTPSERIAYWDRYSHPQTLPSRSIGFPQVWWQDAEKAAKLQTSQ